MATPGEETTVNTNVETSVHISNSGRDERERKREGERLDKIERRLRGLEAEVLSISGRLTERLRQEEKNASQDT